jgi:hypothetical protein
MHLTTFERLSLANQYEILALLDPKHAYQYKKWIEALQDGFESAYDEFVQPFLGGLSSEECAFVTHAMEMHYAMQQCHKKLTEKSGIEAKRLIFPGFDGNSETMHMAYARFLVGPDHRFGNLQHDEDMNCHMCMLSRYRRMIAVWDALPNRYQMSRDELAAVIDAGYR